MFLLNLIILVFDHQKNVLFFTYCVQILQKALSFLVLSPSSSLIMAVAENAGVKIGSSSQNLDSNHTNPPNGIDKPKPRNDQPVKTPPSSNFDLEASKLESSVKGGALLGQMKNGFDQKNQQILVNGLKSNDIGDLAEILSKLNPMAEEFVPPSLVYNGNNNSTYGYLGNGSLGFGYANNFVVHPDAVSVNGLTPNRVCLALLIFVSSSFFFCSISYLAESYDRYDF